MANYGAAGELQRLANQAGVDNSNGGYTGLDLMYQKSLKDAGLAAGGANLDGARVDQLIDARALNQPIARSISPASGTTAGGTAITIRGTGFTGVVYVRFQVESTALQSGNATSVVVVNDTTITCVTPAGVAGLAGLLLFKVGYVSLLNGAYTFT